MTLVDQERCQRIAGGRQRFEASTRPSRESTAVAVRRFPERTPWLFEKRQAGFELKILEWKPFGFLGR